MLSVTCKCGAHYRVPEKLAGKRAKCKHCDHLIPIPAPKPTSAAQPAKPAPPKPQRPPPEPPPVDEHERPSWVPPLVDETHGRDRVSRTPATESFTTFWSDCSWSFLFVSETGNLVSFLIVGAIASIQPLLLYGGCFGMIGSLVVSGWIAAFLFGVVEESALGKREIPTMTLTDGIVDGIVTPFFKFLATWLIVLLPVIVYVVIVGGDVSVLIEDFDPVFFSLFGAGVFIWPMSVLVIAIGGVSSFLRFDLIVVTILKTFLPYLITCVLTAVALGAFWFAREGMVESSGGAASHPMALAMALEVVGLYAWVVAMRVIGLYYFHFKGRFAWSWE